MLPLFVGVLCLVHVLLYKIFIVLSSFAVILVGKRGLGFFFLLFVGPTGVYLLDFFCSGSSILFTVESLSLLYLLFISIYMF